jgi:hypothetical protein
VGLLNRDVGQLVLRVDVDAETVEIELDVGGPGVAGERRAGLAGKLAGAVLDVFDTGVAAVGGVDEVRAFVDLLRVGGEEGLQHGLRGDRARPDQGRSAGRGRYGEPEQGERRDGDGPDSHLDVIPFLSA